MPGPRGWGWGSRMHETWQGPWACIARRSGVGGAANQTHFAPRPLADHRMPGNTLLPPSTAPRLRHSSTAPMQMPHSATGGSCPGPAQHPTAAPEHNNPRLSTRKVPRGCLGAWHTTAAPSYSTHLQWQSTAPIKGMAGIACGTEPDFKDARGGAGKPLAARTHGQPGGVTAAKPQAARP